MSTQYLFKGQWYNLEQYRKLRDMGKEKDVIKVDEEKVKVAIDEPDIPKEKKVYSVIDELLPDVKMRVVTKKEYDKLTKDKK